MSSGTGVEERTDFALANERLKAEVEERKRVELLLRARETELRDINQELDAGVSDVLKALSKISSGDPLTRISEDSKLESIVKLKHMVNITAQELGKIVDLSHEFAIGLAEHFDVLHRVAKGEMTARISAASQVELLELLRNVTNETIASAGKEIARREHAEQQLREHAARLEWRNRELQEFASVASHDLQEPLRKIQAFGDLLEHDAAAILPTSARDYLSRMMQAASRMQELIKALLAYSRVSTKTAPFVRVDLQRIVGEVVDALKAVVDRAQAVVEVDELPSIDADPVQMSQLFQNLILNAIKYSKKETGPVVNISGREISLPGDRRDKWCEIRVEDNGIGFDVRYIDRIFRPFERLHGLEYEGTGMGLAVCRKIVELHGGAITAESIPGEGSVFVLTLPMRQTGEPQPPTT